MFQQVYNCIKPFMLTIQFFTVRTLPKMQKQNLIWISGCSVWCVKKRIIFLMLKTVPACAGFYPLRTEYLSCIWVRMRMEGV